MRHDAAHAVVHFAGLQSADGERRFEIDLSLQFFARGPAHKAFQAEAFFRVRLVVGKIVQHLQIGFGGGEDVVVKTVDGDLFGDGLLERSQSPDEAPRSAGDSCAHAPVDVRFRGRDAQVESYGAAHAASQPRTAGGVDASVLPQTHVGLCQLFELFSVRLGEACHGRTGGLFVAFDEKLDGDGQMTVGVHHGAHGVEAEIKSAFVVGNSAGVHFATADVGFEGRFVCPVFGLAWLDDVVMIVKQQRVGTVAGEPGADQRVTVSHGVERWRQTGAFQVVLKRRAHRVQSGRIAGEAGAGAGTSQFGDHLVEMFVDVTQCFFLVCHETSPFKAARRRIRFRSLPRRRCAPRLR